jgi:hypothetical protein
MNMMNNNILYIEYMVLLVLFIVRSLAERSMLLVKELPDRFHNSEDSIYRWFRSGLFSIFLVHQCLVFNQPDSPGG